MKDCPAKISIGTCATGIVLANMRSVAIRNIRVTGFAGPLISTNNENRTGLAGAAKIDPANLPKVPEPVPSPPTPYQFH